MAQIPVERRPVRTGGGGAWWWVLVIAVIGLVVWLVYEWFDNDYYEDYGYVGTDAYINDQDQGGVARDRVGDEGVGYGDEQQGGVGYEEGSNEPGGMGTMGNSDTLTTLAPVFDAQDVSQFDGRDVRLQGLHVAQVHEDAATVDVNGRQVLVVFDQDARDMANQLSSGGNLSITEGELHEISDLDNPEQYGLSDSMLRNQRFYVEADQVQMAG